MKEPDVAIAPSQKPDDNAATPGSQVSGTDASHAWSGTPAHDGDPTNLVGQYPPGAWGPSIFGGQLPTGSGAPGSQGAHHTSGDDPTNEPGQLYEGLSGLGPRDIAQSGAPGGATTPNTVGGGTTISYTKIGSYSDGTYQSEQVSDDLSGPRDSTQANDEGYATGGPQIPGIAGNEPVPFGKYQPAGGRVLRGGRAIRP